MVLKNGCTVLICTTLLAWSGPSIADQYRADQFLGLDLSKAVLSPKPLGPETHFAPFPVEAASDHDRQAPRTRAETKAAPDVWSPRVGPAHLGVKKPRHARTGARAPAHGHGNPLDAQAFDTRIQVWPCRSGGICNWSPQASELDNEALAHCDAPRDLLRTTSWPTKCWIWTKC